MKSYQYLLGRILNEGYALAPAERQDTGTIQINNASIEHQLPNGFPMLTTKKLSWKNIVVELLWFLKGETNIKSLVDQGCNIWNKDAHKYYVRKYNEYNQGISVGDPLSLETFIQIIKTNSREELSNVYHGYSFGDLGPIYGAQWRNWQGRRSIRGLGTEFTYTDQLVDLIHNIEKAIESGSNNRRLIVNAWNVGQLQDMGLPPCHKDFQVILEPIRVGQRAMLAGETGHLSETDMQKYLDEKDVPKYWVNLTWNQRSVDTFLGLPYNIASYALLMHIIGKLTNTAPKTLYGELRCVHLYNNHLDQAKEQLSREERPLPYLTYSEIFEGMVQNYRAGRLPLDQLLRNLHYADFALEGYNPHPAIQADMIA